MVVQLLHTNAADKTPLGEYDYLTEKDQFADENTRHTDNEKPNMHTFLFIKSQALLWKENLFPFRTSIAKICIYKGHLAKTG